jgi:hypothetical protein
MQTSAPLEDAKAKRSSPRARRLLVTSSIVFTPLLLAGAYFAMDWFQDRSQFNRAVAETNSRDPGWRLSDLEAQRAAIANDENGALQVLAASELIERPLPTDRTWSYVETAQPLVQLNEPQVTRVRAEIEKDALAVAQARKLADLPHGRYPVTWKRSAHEQPPHHVEVPREVTWLLHVDMLLRIAEGDLDGALVSFCAAWNTARSFGDEPFQHAQRVRLGCRANALANLERILGQGEPSIPAMKRAIACILDEDREPLLLIAWRGERAMLYELMEAHHAGELSDVTSLELSRRDVEARALELLTRMIEVAKLQDEDQTAPIKEVSLELSAKPDGQLSLADTNARNWLSTMFSFRNKYLREKARLRSAAVALAAESYRQTHEGRWPEKLSDLTPDFIQELPVDPYNGQPLCYRILDDNVVIYSIGSDLVDDGGRIDDPDIRKCTDVGFRLWNVANRRQAPERVVIPPPDPHGRE